MFKESVDPLVLKRSETDDEDWKVIAALFSIPEEANKIIINYTKVEYFMEDEQWNWDLDL